MSYLRNLNPYDRHKFIINEYVLNRPGGTKLLQRNQSDDKTDINVIRENHKFLWEDDEEDNKDEEETWEQQLAKKYYDKLFKEYTICDLSRYKENKVALRWRIEREVVDGKGQFICGNKVCSITDGLRSWEVHFVYMEHGEEKNALVKLRLCEDCSQKLNYRSKKREIKRLKKSSKKKHKSPTNEHDEENTQKDAVESETTAKSKLHKKSNKRHKHKKGHRRKTDDILSRKHEFENTIEDLLF